MKLVWLPPLLASVASIVIEVSSGIIVIICCMYSSNIMALAAFRVVEVTLTSLIMNLTSISCVLHLFQQYVCGQTGHTLCFCTNS